MENQGRQRRQGEERTLVGRWDALEPFYELATPRWSAYYHKVRRTIRFPRYYKRVLNW